MIEAVEGYGQDDSDLKKTYRIVTYWMSWSWPLLVFVSLLLELQVKQAIATTFVLSVYINAVKVQL